MQQDGLKLSAVRVGLAGRPLVALDCAIAPGQVLTVMGPSGSGKSALIAYIAGFLDPAFEASGSALVGDVDLIGLPPEARRTGILFQDHLLFPHMSVVQNVAFGLPASIRPRRERRHRAERALAEVGIEGYADADPETLSGGQRARVALMRVLVSQPRLLLLDEPFSKLDSALRGQVRDLVFTRARDLGLPVLLVTHDEADAKAAGGPIVVIGETR